METVKEKVNREIGLGQVGDSWRVMKYSWLDYIISKQEYQDNFKKMMDTYPNNKEYCDKEVKLYEKQKKILDALHKTAHDPCPPQTTTSCEDCIGYFKRVPVENNWSTQTREYRICSPDDDKAYKCHIKGILRR